MSAALYATLTYEPDDETGLKGGERTVRCPLYAERPGASTPADQGAHTRLTFVNKGGMKAKRIRFLQSMFKDHHSSLLRFLSGKLSDPHEAEDIAQDAYHNLLRMESPEELENARAYLFQTAANLALNRMRKQRRQHRYAQSVLHDADNDSGLTTTSPEQAAGAQIELKLIMAAVEELPNKCRQAFLMSRSEHKSYAEISKELGVSVSTVEKYLIKALQLLREKLATEAPRQQSVPKARKH